jgi:hypothetical protein
MPTDPWTFGWTQLLTVVGFAITIGVAYFGFRTFARWQRETIAAKKIDIALDTLSVAYQAKYVFDSIRSPMSFPSEWQDMPRGPHESDDEWRRRGPYYAVAKRIDHYKDYFETVWKLQPRFMAVFGRETEEIFALLHKARRAVEIAAHMLGTQGEPYEDALQKELVADIWVVNDRGDDKVGKLLSEFRTKIEAQCFPILNRELHPRAPQGLLSWLCR